MLKSYNQEDKDLLTLLKSDETLIIVVRLALGTGPVGKAKLYRGERSLEAIKEKIREHRVNGHPARLDTAYNYAGVGRLASLLKGQKKIK